tara:strand:- start:1016 stop:1321 length:306 start_codon:yes stop_codon:yes gene_type:complete
MDFLHKFEIVGWIIPNLIGLTLFYDVIIYFDQTRKAKKKTRRESCTPSIKMILFAKAWVIDEMVPNLKRKENWIFKPFQPIKLVIQGKLNHGIMNYLRRNI